VTRVLITCKQLQQTIDGYRAIFADNGIEIDLPELVQQLSEAELLEIIDRYDGVIAGDDQFTARVLEKASRLRILAKWGVGVDGIDLDAARRLGIPVKNTPNVFHDEVADAVAGYIVLLARQLHRLDRSVRDGGWLKIRGMTLSGKVLGVIGMGSIGRAVAVRGAAFGMQVLGYDVAPPSPELVARSGARMVSLEELIRSSDFISLNCNLTPGNRGMLGADEFARMKDGVFIINTARGRLIDQAALVAALRSGKVAGAALDVFEEEPLPAGDPLRSFESCIFGTHNGSNTHEAVLRVNEMAIKNLLDGLKRPRAEA
jgi:phosphoglycerate dehydrogenase-like enzyme